LIRTTLSLLGLSHSSQWGKKSAGPGRFTQGTNAQNAAGVIHTEFGGSFHSGRKFAITTISEIRNMQALKEKGLLRLEGKEIFVKDATS